MPALPCGLYWTCSGLLCYVMPSPADAPFSLYIEGHFVDAILLLFQCCSGVKTISELQQLPYRGGSVRVEMQRLLWLMDNAAIFKLFGLPQGISTHRELWRYNIMR